MKRIWLISAAFLLHSGITKAQNVVMKLGGGLATHYGAVKTIGSFKIGLGYEFEMNGMWSIEPNVLFYSKGWKEKNKDVYKYVNGNLILDENNVPIMSKMNVSVSANYIEVPILFNYYWEQSPQRYLVLTAGPYAAYGITGKIKTKGDTDLEGAERFFKSTDTFKEPGAHRLDLGLQVAVSYEFTHNLCIGVEGDFGLLKTSTTGGRNFSGLVSLSYKLSTN